MEESRLVDLFGLLAPSLLEEDFLERDLKASAPSFLTSLKGKTEKRFHNRVLWLAAGITAGSIAATGGILLAVRRKKAGRAA